MIEVHTVAGHPFKDDDRDVDQNGDWSRRLLPVECNVCVLRPKQESQLKSNPKAVCLRDNVADVEADVWSSSSQSIALSSLFSRLLKKHRNLHNEESGFVPETSSLFLSLFLHLLWLTCLFSVSCYSSLSLTSLFPDFSFLFSVCFSSRQTLLQEDQVSKQVKAGMKQQVKQGWVQEEEEDRR